MDSKQFDRMIQRWSSGAPRRAMLGLLAGGVLGLAGLEESTAKRKKKVTLCFSGETIVVKKSKKGALLSQGATQGACAASPPPPPPQSPPPPPPMVSCEDGVKNGDETDTDCGGSCPRCANNQQCQNREDCASALCANNVCITCRSSDQCGQDDFSSCTCNSSICTSRRGRTIMGGTCADCPSGTTACDVLFDRVNCRPRCGVVFS